MKDVRSNLCFKCFCVEGKCQCKHPEYILIDSNMITIIKVLNKKGYKTRYCCGGHIGEYFIDVYIKFNKDYEYELPKGYHIYKNGIHHIKKKFNILSIKDQRSYIKDQIRILREWAKRLKKYNRR